MDLAERLANDIAGDSKLVRVPYPVIEAVLRIGIARLANIVPAGFDATEMDAVDFEACESCSTLIDPAHPAGAREDSDGIWECDACQVDGGAEEG